MRAIIFFLIIQCLISGCDYLEEKYHGIPAKQLRKTKVYKEIYNETLKELEAGNFDENFDFWVKRGEGSVEELILASDYKFRPVSFMDIKEANWQEYELGLLEAIDAYFIKQYGKDFWEKLQAQAKVLNDKYRVEHYDTIMEGLIQKGYHREFINDSIEIGVFNKKILDTTFFRVEVDTVSSFNNSEYFSFKKVEHQIVFTATTRSHIDSTIFFMATPYLLVYWDTSKIDFPYYQYPLISVPLPAKYH